MQSSLIGPEIASQKALAMTMEGKGHCEERSLRRSNLPLIGPEIASQKALAMTMFRRI
jgi:hypothetical protein